MAKGGHVFGIAALLLALACVCCGRNGDKAAPSGTPVAKQTAETGDIPPQPFNVWGTLVPGERLTVHWIEGVRGDYNGDGSVNGKDLFRVAARFNLKSDYHEQSAIHAEEAADNCIDGNRDGVINGLDVFLIAAQFDKTIDGYRLYDSHEGGAFVELTDSQLPVQPRGEKLCLAEYEWETDRVASDPGSHVVKVLACGNGAEAHPADGADLFLWVRDEWEIAGSDREAAYAMRGADYRNSYRSAYAGPREYDENRAVTLPYDANYVYGIFGVGGHERGYTFSIRHTQPQGEVDVIRHYSSPLPGELEWSVPTPDPTDGAWSGHCFLLSGGDLGFIDLIDNTHYAECYRLYVNDPEENPKVDRANYPLKLETDTAELTRFAGPTPDGDVLIVTIFGKPDDETTYSRIHLIDRFGTELLPPKEIAMVDRSFGTGGVIYARIDHFLLSISGQLTSIDRTTLEEGWSWEWYSGEPDDTSISLSLARDDDIYFAANVDESWRSNVGFWGVLSPEGELKCVSEQYFGRADLLVPYGEDRGLLTFKYSGSSVEGYIALLDLSGDEPSEIWRNEMPWIPVISCIDAEGKIYASQSDNYICFNPDGSVQHSGRGGGGFTFIGDQQELIDSRLPNVVYGLEELINSLE